MTGHLFRTALHHLRSVGLDLPLLVRSLRGAPRFLQDMRVYGKANANSGRFNVQLGSLYPCLSDYHQSAGEVGGHYFHQDLWAARKVFEQRPATHLDVGSRIDGFVAHLLSFMPVTIVDVRPLDSHISELTFVQADATNLEQLADDSVESISSLHAVEHFGLGRYGDPIAPDACFQAMRALSRVLQPDGRLYFGVPIGVERLQFNAHRVFSPNTIVDAFSGLTLISFSAIDDRGRFIEAANLSDFAAADYACGCFEFTK